MHHYRMPEVYTAGGTRFVTIELSVTIHFAHWCLHQNAAKSDICAHVLFTGKFIFTREGVFKTYNSYTLASYEPACHISSLIPAVVLLKCLGASILQGHLVDPCYTIWTANCIAYSCETCYRSCCVRFQPPTEAKSASSMTVRLQTSA